MRPLVVLDVPYLAQGVDLCGGAAAAMVLRYWGQRDVHAEDFASLVREDEHGIRARDLVSALGSRGASARAIRAEPEDARSEIASGRPVIALIDGGGGRLHYVVIVAWASGRVLFHDPAVGPFRLVSEPAFLSSWKATGGFAIVLTPGETAVDPEPPALPAALVRRAGACGPLVDHAIDVARGPDPELAVGDLRAASELCPEDADAFAALAGVRFRQKRWLEAADLAIRATRLDAADSESWRLLGASLYLADEPREALVAWNRIEEPRLDRVLIEGLNRTRQDIVTAVIGLHPRDPLTPDSLLRAERRLDQLPTVSAGKIIYRPLASGRADAVASVGEGGLIEPGVVLALRVVAEFIGKREARIRLNSPMGRGEALEVGGRFASSRPAFWASLETPRLAGLPGVVALGGLWDRQTYGGVDSSAGATIENRRRGAADWSHWATSSLRLELGLAVDRFDGQGTFVSLRGGADRRLFSDRAALLADGASWVGVNGARGFAEFGGTAAFRNGVRPRRWAFHARLDGRRATETAPLALWPGAGDGASRAFLLRGTRFVSDGVVVGESFGRGLLHATAEAEVRIAEHALIRLGLAAFGDWARAWDSGLGSGPRQSIFGVGAGLRFHAPGSMTFRIDVAKRPGTTGVRVSAGVLPAWPRR